MGVRWAVVMAVVVGACGGSSSSDASAPDDGGSSTTAATIAPTSTTATTAASTTTTTATAASEDFCDFVIAYDAELDARPIPTTPAETEAFFTDNLAAIEEAGELAPDELADDIAMFVVAYRGLIEVLSEVGWSFAGAAAIPEDDPRLVALDDPELEAAGERIESFCGIDDFIATAPPAAEPDGAGEASSDLPEGFAEELLPADSVVVTVVTVGGADSVTFDANEAIDEVIAFYVDLLGEPTQQLESPPGALWVTTYDGRSLTLTVAEAQPGMVQGNVTLAP